MTLDSTGERLSISRSQRLLYLGAALLTFLLLVMGGIVCVTDSSGGCPDWPACYGQLVPPARLDSILEYTHRVLAAVTSLSIVASAIAGWQHRHSSPWINWSPIAALPFLLIVATLGAMVVLRGIGPGLAALDLGSALIVLALMLIPPVRAFTHHRAGTRFSLRTGHSRLTLGALASIFVVLVSAVLVADPGSVARCLGWPLANARVLRGDPKGWLQLARFAIGGAAALLLIVVVVQTWRTWRHRPEMLILTASIAVILGLEILLGTRLGSISVVWPLAIYAMLAVALWALVVVLTVLVGFEPQPVSGSS
jgi:cytochrome c oxidase assembly protein subunit 15